MGTLWRARIQLTVPMLFALAWFFNFLIGGIFGIYLSDVPSDVLTPWVLLVMAHFHYTIMGGAPVGSRSSPPPLLLAPEDDRRWSCNERLAKGAFMGHVHLLQLDGYPAAFRARPQMGCRGGS